MGVEGASWSWGLGAPARALQNILSSHGGVLLQAKDFEKQARSFDLANAGDHMGDN
jgi:hypothetical protein